MRVAVAAMLAGVAAVAAVPAAADVIPVAVDLKPPEITVGGRVRAKLILVWDGEKPSGEPRFPEWVDTWGEAEVLEVSDVDAFPDQSGRFVYSQELVLTAFEVGEVELPERTVALPLADETVEIPVEVARFTVKSVLPEPEPADPSAAPGPTSAPPADPASLEPRPAAPLVDLGTSRRFFLTAVVLVALTVVLIHVLLGRLRQAALGAGAAGLRLLAPFDELLARLDGLDLDGNPEIAHTGLSLGLRSYLGRSLGFHAVESTTTEVQRRLRDTPVPPATSQQVVGLLRDCDQVKFARLDVESAVTAKRVESVRRVARGIEAVLRPASPSDGAAEAAQREAARREAERGRRLMRSGRWHMAIGGLWSAAGIALALTSIRFFHAEKVLLALGLAELVFGLFRYHKGAGGAG